MIIFLQNGYMCVLKDIIGVKLLLDKTGQVLLDEAYKHDIMPVLSNSVENSM